MKLQKSVRLFADGHLEKLGNVFETLYKDSLLTDCILYCKDGSIKAHKVILAASSRYFRQVFIDHADDNAIFMYGISYSQLKNLVELIYRGSIDVPSDSFNAVFGLAEELCVTGVLVEPGQDIKTNGVGRDTRYRGQKRVAVDFETRDEPVTSTPKPPQPSPTERRASSSSESVTVTPNKEADTEKEFELVQPKNERTSPTIDADSVNENDIFIGHDALDDGEQGDHLSVWAKKERKFKCDLCPSSFKRASHLSRHQLVHTGERPFACAQCDKAFSRHDKLKHHVHKSHELDAINDSLGPDSLYTIDRVDILTPETNIVESSSTLDSHQRTEPNMSSSSILSGDCSDQPQKKGRGRPRKYPPMPKPLAKRPRGRPRINPIAARPHVRRARGRPRINPIGSYGFGHGSYQPYHRDSYGELEYFQKYHSPSEMESSQEMLENSEIDNDPDLMDHDRDIMEPLVEIKTDMVEKSPDQEGESPMNNASFFENIGLLNNSAIAKIGECTISVATNSSSSSGLTKAVEIVKREF